MRQKPGTCPKERIHCTSFTSSCHTDFDCPNYLKCCNFNCGKKCLDPYRAKVGRCPYYPLRNNMDCSNTCLSDYDCPDTDKCCSSTCGFICAKAWKVKRSDCPEILDFCEEVEKPQCQVDDDCPDFHKCCSDCGLKCIDPFSWVSSQLEDDD
ncbi:WAP four-disulfide core domain protein 8 [Orycteropus afer afer]|uniref:WAP four-disulfide core domain protein 8 n=1 Tax=Orycteropus afer afer TaxID=1230840 RepID=A0A8B6ZRU2_ORYAF|nr:WAP four-disulfide core domain protein 8 [Orycteropus afer afer]